MKIKKAYQLILAYFVITAFSCKCADNKTSTPGSTNSSSTEINEKTKYYFEWTLEGEKYTWSGERPSENEPEHCFLNPNKQEGMQAVLDIGYSNLMYPSISFNLPFNGLKTGTFSFSRSNFGDFILIVSEREIYGTKDVQLKITEIDSNSVSGHFGGSVIRVDGMVAYYPIEEKNIGGKFKAWIIK
jgi:hypothetical protein